MNPISDRDASLMAARHAALLKARDNINFIKAQLKASKIEFADALESADLLTAGWNAFVTEEKFTCPKLNKPLWMRFAATDSLNETFVNVMQQVALTFHENPELYLEPMAQFDASLVALTLSNSSANNLTGKSDFTIDSNANLIHIYSESHMEQIEAPLMPDLLVAGAGYRGLLALNVLKEVPGKVFLSDKNRYVCLVLEETSRLLGIGDKVEVREGSFGEIELREKSIGMLNVSYVYSAKEQALRDLFRRAQEFVRNEGVVLCHSMEVGRNSTEVGTPSLMKIIEENKFKIDRNRIVVVPAQSPVSWVTRNPELLKLDAKQLNAWASSKEQFSNPITMFAATKAA